MPALLVENLSKTYRGGVVALDDVSFSVTEGDFFALLGPNGAGKSTLISILSSLVDKTSGHVEVFGCDIDQNFNQVKAMLGLVPQEFNFNVFSTVEQILVGQAGFYGIARHEALIRAEKYAKQLGLSNKLHSSARSLSGGMRRRLLIARALIHEPKMLILDEPTAGVDIELRRLMWDFLIELNQSGTTIILTTHYLEEAESLCRNIAIIDRGSLLIQSTMAAILKKLDVERFILYLQDAIGELPKIDDYRLWKVDETTLEVEVLHHIGLSKLFERLGQLGIRVISMRNKVGRLEELFLRLTREPE